MSLTTWYAIAQRDGSVLARVLSAEKPTFFKHHVVVFSEKELEAIPEIAVALREWEKN